MHLFLTIIVFIVILSVLVLLHELGHYYFARRAGVRIDEFGFGLPPRLWGKKVGETIYSVNAFPFGGFVRLFGENPQEPGMTTDPRSFNAKSLRERFTIVFAGVAMNFILAVVLLSVGFFFGIKPLLMDSQDVFQAIKQHQVVLHSGFMLQKINNGSLAEQMDLHVGDLIMQVNGGAFLDASTLTKALSVADTNGIILHVRRGDSILKIAIPKEKFSQKHHELGVTFYDNLALPRVGIQSIKDNTDVSRSGLRAGDILLSINDTPIYSLDDFQSTFLAYKSFKLRYQRDFSEYETTVNFPQRKTISISEVLGSSPAAQADFHKGDIVLQVQHKDVASPEDVLRLLQEAKKDTTQPAQFLIERGGKSLTLYVSPGKDGTYGLQFTTIINQNVDMITSELSVPTSVLEIKPVSYSFFGSIGMAFKETYRLGKATIGMFGSLIHDIFSNFSVPEGVSGPVGIAQMTGTFVDEGLLSLIRFMAMLSLSLSILNLLPFPGLDGGRLLFIVLEAVFGRRVNQKFEQSIHIIGALFLILMILLVTYKDIVRLF